MNLIEVKKLIYEYIRRDKDGNVDGITTAIDKVDLDISQGDFVAILGHNGSGKSTLAKHLNAIYFPEEGVVYVDGKDTSDPKNIWDVRQTTGMVFQNPDNQIIGSIVEEDVGFGPENMGIAPEEIWDRVEESLEAVGMYEHRERSPRKLSGGQKQRVAIAGIVAMKPKCIVLDEPTAMLDPKGRADVIRTIKKLNRENSITIILITHNMEEVVDADKVYVMDKGRLVMQGSPREIFSQVDELKEIRLDVPQITELAYELNKEGIPLPKGILSREELVEELCRLL
ncbi:MAG: energy-coupling factor transporter ATPase [Lachnospiraceae bacterium]|nr:energy-coupling factor transporter ATPase [Lachnospiraceae bacterium]